MSGILPHLYVTTFGPLRQPCSHLPVSRSRRLLRLRASTAITSDNILLNGSPFSQICLRPVITRGIWPTGFSAHDHFGHSTHRLMVPSTAFLLSGLVVCVPIAPSIHLAMSTLGLFLDAMSRRPGRYSSLGIQFMDIRLRGECQIKL